MQCGTPALPRGHGGCLIDSVSPKGKAVVDHEISESRLLEPTDDRYRILVVDDDRALRETLCEIVEPFLLPMEADSGEAAIDLARHCEIHIVVCDMQMSVLTGLETLAQIRKLHATAPRILMTANYSEGLVRQARAELACDVLSKPFCKTAFIESIATALAAAYHATQLANRLSHA